MTAQRLLRVEIAGAVVMVAVMAVTLAVYIPAARPLEFGAVAFTIAAWLAMFAVFAPVARIRRLGRVPVAARIEAGYGRSASRPVKAWAAACAVAGLVVLVAPGHVLPEGDASRSDGGYVETSHGAVLRSLTREEFEEEQMTNVRFALGDSRPRPIAELAAALYLSPGTTRNHLSAIMQKLDAHSRIEAIRVAEERGWL
jgi:hypothetical protein